MKKFCIAALFAVLTLVSADIQAQSKTATQVLPDGCAGTSVFLNATTGCVSTFTGIMKTNNAGDNWESVYYNPFYVDQICMKGSVGYALSINAAFHTPTLIRTTDQGNTWSVRYNSEAMMFYRLYLDDNGDLYGFCSEPTSYKAYKSSDGGSTWNLMALPTNSGIAGFLIVNNQGYMLAGGKLWTSTPGLASWTSYNVPLYNACGLQHVGSRIYVGGQVADSLNDLVPAIAYTSNLGADWNIHKFPNPGVCVNLRFSPTGNGYAVGWDDIDKGWLKETTDQGMSWHTVWDSIDVRMTDVKALNGVAYASGYLTGEWTLGIVIRLSDMITHVLHTPIPSGYVLQQNRPNPFNPSTTIEFTMPKSGIVKLTIVDINGKFVAQLLNEYKATGNHSIAVDGSELSSGTYFYRIETNEFSATKKMILVK